MKVNVDASTDASLSFISFDAVVWDATGHFIAARVWRRRGFFIVKSAKAIGICD